MILINSFYDVVEILTSPADNSLNSPSKFFRVVLQLAAEPSIQNKLLLARSPRNY